MPFTFSHPAAVLPLRRTRLVFSALVIGSMAPDFEYFFGVARPTSHSMPGIVTFTFPVALATLVIFHTLVKWPLISLLPRGVQARVIGPARRFQWWPATRLASILLSLAVGMATHLFWDAFTHEEGWVVEHWSWLQAPVRIFARRSFHVYFLLQFASTAAGVMIIAWCFYRWYVRAPSYSELPRQLSPATSRTILAIIVVTAVTAGLLRGGAGSEALLRGLSHRLHFLVGVVITTITVAAIELFGFSLIWRAFVVRQAPRDAMQLPVESKGSIVRDRR